MKNILSFLGLAAFSIAQSAHAIEVPKVHCELMYTDDAAPMFEISESISATTGKGTQISNEGFTLNAKLEGKRAAGSRPMPIFAYELVATLSDATHSSMISVALDKPFARYSFSLTTGSKSAFVNCDHDRE